LYGDDKNKKSKAVAPEEHEKADLTP